MGCPDVGDTAHAGVKSLFKGNGHGRWRGEESDALSEQLIVALAELGGDGLYVLVHSVYVCRWGRQLPGVEVEGCSWVICLFEGWHRSHVRRIFRTFSQKKIKRLICIM